MEPSSYEADHRGHRQMPNHSDFDPSSHESCRFSHEVRNFTRSTHNPSLRKFDRRSPDHYVVDLQRSSSKSKSLLHEELEFELKSHSYKYDPKPRYSYTTFPAHEDDFDVPAFDGNSNVDGVLLWIEEIEEMLECVSLVPEKQAKFVAKGFMGYANFWWKQLKENRRHLGKKQILTWKKMREKLEKHFLPLDYVYKQNYDSWDLRCTERHMRYNNCANDNPIWPRSSFNDRPTPKQNPLEFSVSPQYSKPNFVAPRLDTLTILDPPSEKNHMSTDKDANDLGAASTKLMIPKNQVTQKVYLSPLSAVLELHDENAKNDAVEKTLVNVSEGQSVECIGNEIKQEKAGGHDTMVAENSKAQRDLQASLLPLVDVNIAAFDITNEVKNGFVLCDGNLINELVKFDSSVSVQTFSTNKFFDVDHEKYPTATMVKNGLGIGLNIAFEFYKDHTWKYGTLKTSMPLKIRLLPQWKRGELKKEFSVGVYQNHKKKKKKNGRSSPSMDLYTPLEDSGRIFC